jgi:hypothetical protein
VPATIIEIDAWLAAALRGDAAPWCASWTEADEQPALHRIDYHGIGGLLVDAAQANSWPAVLQSSIRQRATAQAMWDMRHRAVLAELCTQLAARGVRHALLKGTAIAYRLYDIPYQRGRADSDLLVEPHCVAPTRAALCSMGFQPAWGEMRNLDSAFQEGWQLTHTDGSTHPVDLHWQTINARSLRGLMPVGDCLDHAAPLDRLSNDARTLDPARLLLHACLHRLMHRTAPYVVGGTAYYGGERLIWAFDIKLLAASLDDAQWRQFADLAVAAEVAPVCLDAFGYAERTVGATVPAAVRAHLAAAPEDSPASHYLLQSGRTRRLVSNLRAGGGLRAGLAFAKDQLFPSADILRVHYPHLAHLPRTLLLMHRWSRFALSKKGD